MIPEEDLLLVACVSPSVSHLNNNFHNTPGEITLYEITEPAPGEENLSIHFRQEIEAESCYGLTMWYVMLAVRLSVWMSLWLKCLSIYICILT